MSQIKLYVLVHSLLAVKNLKWGEVLVKINHVEHVIVTESG